MKCWVCKREARGFGHLDVRFGRRDPRRYPLDWVFCSRRCQEAFHALYERRMDATKWGERFMIDASDIERAAMRDCLKAFGEAAESIGFDKPLGAYSEAEALAVIDAIVTRYTEALTAHHERALAQHEAGAEAVRDPFADLACDLPWETDAQPDGARGGVAQ